MYKRDTLLSDERRSRGVLTLQNLEIDEDDYEAWDCDPDAYIEEF